MSVPFKTYLLFHVVGYNTKLDDANLTDKVVISLIDTDYDSALTRAKNIVPRNVWFLAEVVEYKEVVKES